MDFEKGVWWIYGTMQKKTGSRIGLIKTDLSRNGEEVDYK